MYACTQTHKADDLPMCNNNADADLLPKQLVSHAADKLYSSSLNNCHPSLSTTRLALLSVARHQILKVKLAHIGLPCVGTSKSMQGLFSLLKAFDSIKDHDQELQRQLLTHSQDLYDLSGESAVHLLRHNVRSAGQLMGLLQKHAPKEPGEDHLLMLQGPLQDMVCCLHPDHVFLRCLCRLHWGICISLRISSSCSCSWSMLLLQRLGLFQELPCGTYRAA